MQPVLYHRCDIARYSAVGTNGRRQHVPVHTDVPCLVLPMSPTETISEGFSVGTAWNFFFDEGADVRAGDQITFSGTKYYAKGVQAFTGIPHVSHTRVSATTEARNG